MGNNPKIIGLEKIKEILGNLDPFQEIKNGFIAYSNGDAVIPPVGELVFSKPPGDVHIKYGYLKNQPYYVIKIASGFYDNPSIGLPSSQGLNLLFDKNNGELLSILLDEGHLTDVRTAVAGALASQSLARENAKTIGIVGAGIQAKFQLEYHHKLLGVSDFLIWNRDPKKSENLEQKLKNSPYNIRVFMNLKELCDESDIIVTTTPSSDFLIHDSWIRKGTHITAIGSDTAHKIELDPKLLERADIVTVDSLSQSEQRGEVFRARKEGFLHGDRVIELGSLLLNENSARKSEDEITIADLTGVAVQDLMISQAVYNEIKNEA